MKQSNLIERYFKKKTYLVFADGDWLQAVDMTLIFSAYSKPYVEFAGIPLTKVDPWEIYKNIIKCYLLSGSKDIKKKKYCYNGTNYDITRLSSKKFGLNCLLYKNTKVSWSFKNKIKFEYPNNWVCPFQEVAVGTPSLKIEVKPRSEELVLMRLRVFSG